MRNFLWRIVAFIVTIPVVTDWLIERAKRTPYSHIPSRDGKRTYMRRWWLFNPYGKADNGDTLPPRWEWLPSIRVHHILLADDDQHMHDHPWDARTIVLRGYYLEQLPLTADRGQRGFAWRWHECRRGYTGRLEFGEYHRIHTLSGGGVYTLFFTWKYMGTWGFLVDGVKVPWRKYLGLEL